MENQVGVQNQNRLIELGLTIAAVRKLEGLSQEMLAERAKISRSRLSSIEAPHMPERFLWRFCSTSLMHSALVPRTI